MSRSILLAAVAGVTLISGSMASAQIAISAKTTFNPSGAFPGSLVFGEVPWLTDNNTQRGIGYNPVTGNVLLVDRNGTTKIQIINGQTGVSPGTMDLTGVSGGNFLLNQVGVTTDGVVYAANLQTPTSAATPYKIYRWANESAVPTTYYAGNGGIDGLRLGDSFDVAGSDATGMIAVGWAINSPNNRFTTIPTGSGSPTATAMGIAASSPVTTPGADLFRRGLAIIDNDNVLGKIFTTGTGVIATRVPGSNPVTSNFVNTGLIQTGSIGALDYAVVNGTPLLAAVDTNSNIARVFDFTDPANPIQAATLAIIAPGTPAAGNGNATASVAWGGVVGRTASLYTLNTNNGISAYNVNVPIRAGWKLDVDGNFADSTKWNGGVPDFAGDTATFGPVITAPRTVTITTPTTTGRVALNSAGTNSYTITGSALTVQSSGTGGTAVTVSATGSHTISAPIILGSNATFAVTAGSRLNTTTIKPTLDQNVLINGDGTLGVSELLVAGLLNFGGTTTRLDIGTGGVLLYNATEAATRLQVSNWYANGLRSGVAIGSSSATLANNTMLATILNTDASTGGKYFNTFKGEALEATDVLVVYTYMGDTNLDGKLDGSDVSNFLESYSVGGLTGWQNGDFDYNGLVDLADYTLLTNALTAYTGVQIATGLTGGGIGGGAIPEPAGLGLLAGVGTLSLRRRARRTA